MDYLSKTRQIYVAKIGGDTYRFDEHDIEHDQDQGPMAKIGDVYVRAEPLSAEDCPNAEWWSVAVYTDDRIYGGPEEGGWYYAAGQLVNHARIRFFDDYAAARGYQEELWTSVEAENKARSHWDDRLTVRCTTEAMPATHYPLKRPYYS